MSNARQEGMTVNVKVGMWMGHKLDRKVTAKVTTEAGASSDAARVNKHLLAKEVLQPIQTAGGAIKLHLYASTLPWKNNGDRFITRKAFFKFMQQHEKLKWDFDAAVDHFLAVKYGPAKSQAKFRMGEMFDITDYPSPERLRSCFYTKLDIDGIPEAYDERLVDNEAAIQERVTKAMDGLWRKLAEPLEKFVERTTADEVKRFHATTITNLQAIADAVPDLNFMNDPRLEAIASDVRKLLARVDLKDIKNDDAIRHAAGAEAKTMLSTLQGIIGNMGEDEDDE